MLRKRLAKAEAKINELVENVIALNYTRDDAEKMIACGLNGHTPVLISPPQAGSLWRERRHAFKCLDCGLRYERILTVAKEKAITELYDSKETDNVGT